MGYKMIQTINVHALDGVKPKMERSAPLTLDLKVEMSKEQLVELVLNSLEDFDIETLNKAFNREGLNLTKTENF